MKCSFCEHSKFQWLLLILFAGIILFINVWSDGIYSAQEGRAAIVARQMIRNGNWMHLDIKAAHNTEKPIMCYWFYALSGELFGVNEFSVRLPSILAALATVLMTCALGIRIYGRQTGFLAGYLIASMAGFVNLGRLARIDIVLCAFYTAAMFLLYTGYFEKMKANWRLYLFYLVLALSVMVKGPVSVALVGLTVIVLVIKERNWKILWELKPISGLFIGLAVNAPWYTYEIIRTNGQFAKDFFLNQNISRFTGINMTYHDGKRQSYFYYIPKLFALMLPWSLLAPFAIFNFRKSLLKFKPATYYLLTWFIVIFVFFSLAAIKRGDYLLPLFAPVAILLGRYLHWLIEKKMTLPRKWWIVWAAFSGLAIICLIIIKFGWMRYVGELAVTDKINFICKRDGMGMIQASDLINNMFVLSCLGAALVLGFLYMLGSWFAEGKSRNVIYALFGAVLVIFCVFYIWIDPSQNKYKTVKYFCERSRPHIKPNEKVCYYRQWITETVFFLDRDYARHAILEEIYDDKSGKVKYKYIITEPKIYNSFPPELKNKLVKLEETIPGHQYPNVLLKVAEPAN